MPAKDKATAPGTAAAKMFSDLQNAGFGSMTWMGTAWLEQMGDLGAEWLEFLARRVKEDVKMQCEVLECNDISELQDIQTKFMQKAADQYQEETGKLVDLGNAIMTNLHTGLKDKG